MNTIDKLQLGDEVKDTISGLSGVVVAETQWLHGCRRLTVQPRTLHEGKPIEGHTFDEGQLERVTKQAVPVGSRDKGGPRPEPSRAPSPTR
jgi:hypothetical protein